MVVVSFLRTQVWPVLVWAWGICTALTLAMRAIPEEPFVRFEAAYPRLGKAARAVRKFGTDLVPFVRSVVAAFRGAPPLAILFAVMLAPALQGCPMPPPDHCVPSSTRCSPDGVPQTCSGSMRWQSGATQRPCAALGAAVCCVARSPYGNTPHACVPPSECADGGAQ